MSYEAILEAARGCDPILLRSTLKNSSIDQWKKNTFYFSAGSQLAVEKNFIAINFLLKQGADVNYIARGAALGGHRDYAEELRTKQGADVNAIAVGAAQGGYLVNEKRAFEFLIFFKNPTVIHDLINAAKKSPTVPGVVKNQIPNIQKRIESTLGLKFEYNLDIHQAIVMQANKPAAVTTWMLQIMPKLLIKNNSRPGLLHNLLLFITMLAFDLTKNEILDLQFNLNRTLLRKSISQYCSSGSKFFDWFSSPKSNALHKERAMSFQDAMSTTDPGSFKILCQNQIRLFAGNNRYDKEGITPLISAVQKGWIEVATDLLRQGVDPNIVRKKDGETPLNIAVKAANINMINLLIQFGANSNLANSNGQTAYHLAALLNDEKTATNVIKALGEPNQQLALIPAHEKGVGGYSEDDPFYLSIIRTNNRLF